MQETTHVPNLFLTVKATRQRKIWYLTQLLSKAVTIFVGIVKFRLVTSGKYKFASYLGKRLAVVELIP